MKDPSVFLTGGTFSSEEREVRNEEEKRIRARARFFERKNSGATLVAWSFGIRVITPSETLSNVLIGMRSLLVSVYIHQM